MFLQVFLLSICVSHVLGNCNEITNAWNTGANGEFSIKIPSNTNGWKVTVTFDQDVQGLSVWQGSNLQCSGNVCTFENASWNGYQNSGATLKLGYQVMFK